MRGDGDDPVPDKRALARLQAATNVDLNWLLDDSMDVPPDGKPVLRSGGECGHSEHHVTLLRMPSTMEDNEYPVVSYAAAATDGMVSEFEEPVDESLTLPAGTGVVEVRGYSMEPLALDGQRVFIAPEKRKPVEGDLVVVWATNGSMRQLFKRWGGWINDHLLLLSVNPQDRAGMRILVHKKELVAVRVVCGVWFE